MRGPERATFGINQNAGLRDVDLAVDINRRRSSSLQLRVNLPKWLNHNDVRL